MHSANPYWGKTGKQKNGLVVPASPREQELEAEVKRLRDEMHDIKRRLHAENERLHAELAAARKILDNLAEALVDY